MKQWIMGIFSACLLTAVAMAITPKNKRAAALAGGLIIILAAVKPLTTVTARDISQYLAKYQMKADELRTGIDVENRNIMALIIQEQTEAYILDKALELGLEITASVTVETADDGWPYPAGVRIIGDLSESDIQRLSRFIETELAIEPDRQEWS